VQIVPDGLIGIALAEQRRHDVILLDIRLPGMDGERILHKLRQQGIRIPVIMLMARDADRDKIRNLEMIDALRAPIGWRACGHPPLRLMCVIDANHCAIRSKLDELVARMRAVLRRSQMDRVLRIGTPEINTDTREVWRADASRTMHGNGPGLSIAQQIVVQNGGTVEVTSVPGAGTTFTIQLPIARRG